MDTESRVRMERRLSRIINYIERSAKGNVIYMQYLSTISSYYFAIVVQTLVKYNQYQMSTIQIKYKHTGTIE